MSSSAPRTILFVLVAGYAAVSFMLARDESTTMDERAHIPAAFTYIDALDIRINPEHPPLIKALSGAALQLGHFSFPYDSHEWTKGNNEQWSLGVHFIHSNKADYLTTLARLPTIAIALFLGLFLFFWTSRQKNIIAGIVAALLFFCDPNMIAHGHYVTTDIAISAFIFFAITTFLDFLKKPDIRSFSWATLFLALSQLTKFSAVILLPYFLFLATIWAGTSSDILLHIGKTRLKHALLAILKQWWLCGIIFICAYVLVGITYGIITMGMPTEVVNELISNNLPHEGAHAHYLSIVRFIQDIPIVNTLALYLLGLFMVFVRVDGGNTFFFLGNVLTQAERWYFPVVFILKETLPFLALVIIMTANGLAKLVRFVLHFVRRDFPEGTNRTDVVTVAARRHFPILALTVFIILYATVSIRGNLNIGLRHLFPIFPPLYALTGISVAFFIERAVSNKARIAIDLSVGSLLLWSIIIPFSSYPSYLSYYNEIVGGPKNGYQYASDSNYDWGQDLLRLKKWFNQYNDCAVRAEKTALCHDFMQQIPESARNIPIDTLRIDYFGGADPQYYFGTAFKEWHANYKPESGWYAISLGFLQENLHEEREKDTTGYEWTQVLTPVARAGDSIVILYFESRE